MGTTLWLSILYNVADKLLLQGFELVFLASFLSTQSWQTGGHSRQCCYQFIILCQDRYGANCLMLVDFHRKVLAESVIKMLKQGVWVNCEENQFLGCSSSGLRKHTCYMLQGTKEDGGDSMEGVWKFWSHKVCLKMLEENWAALLCCHQWRSQVIGFGRAPGQYQCMLACAHAILRDMGGTNAVLWAGTCPARPTLRYTTGCHTNTCWNSEWGCHRNWWHWNWWRQLHRWLWKNWYWLGKKDYERIPTSAWQGWIHSFCVSDLLSRLHIVKDKDVNMAGDQIMDHPRVKNTDLNMTVEWHLGISNTGVQEVKISGDDKVEVTRLSLKIKVTEDNTII